MKQIVWLAGIALCLSLAPQASAQSAPPSCTQSGATPPKAANSHVSGEYPPLSQVLGEQGNTDVEFVIGEDGSIGSVRVAKSSGSLRLDDAAVASVKTWRYVPAQAADGKPFACLWKARVAWVLHDGAPTLPPGFPGVVLQMKPQDYPPGALDRKEEGFVGLLAMQSGDKGDKIALVLHSSGYPDLDEATVKLVMARLQMTNATIDGKPIGAMVAVIVVWSPGPPNPSQAAPGSSDIKPK